MFSGSFGVSRQAAQVSLQVAVTIGLDASRSLVPQDPTYRVRQFSDVSGLGAGTEAGFRLGHQADRVSLQAAVTNWT